VVSNDMIDNWSPRFRAYLPLSVPLAINLILSFLITLNASSALKSAQCRLALPWDGAASVEILRLFYPAALEEVEILKDVSSSCISTIHADLASAYIATIAISLFCGFLSLPFTIFLRARPSPESKIKERKARIAALLLFIGILVLSFLVIYYNGLIDFSGKVRRMIHLRNGYVNLFSYLLKTQMLFLVMTLGLWSLYVFIVSLSRLLRENKNKIDPINGRSISR
jgi:hypothetical protein